MRWSRKGRVTSIWGSRAEPQPPARNRRNPRSSSLSCGGVRHRRVWLSAQDDVLWAGEGVEEPGGGDLTGERWRRSHPRPAPPPWERNRGEVEKVKRIRRSRFR
jgi:hypothetical protein